MSADTKVVIAASHLFGNESELAYTAAVVQAADNLDSPTCEHTFKWAKANFFEGRHEWFTGKGGLSRAKQLANILAEEQRENGILEHEDRPIFEIGEDRIYFLTRKGHRQSASTC